MKATDEISQSELLAGLRYTVYSEGQTLKREVEAIHRVTVSHQLAQWSAKLAEIEKEFSSTQPTIKPEESQVQVDSIDELRNLVYAENEKLWKEKDLTLRVTIVDGLAKWSARLAGMEAKEAKKAAGRVEKEQSNSIKETPEKDGIPLL